VFIFRIWVLYFGMAILICSWHKDGVLEYGLFIKQISFRYIRPSNRGVYIFVQNTNARGALSLQFYTLHICISLILRTLHFAYYDDCENWASSAEFPLPLKQCSLPPLKPLNSGGLSANRAPTRPRNFIMQGQSKRKLANRVEARTQSSSSYVFVLPRRRGA
jgi:hypothetical protein